jgi:hypothetical protein
MIFSRLIAAFAITLSISACDVEHPNHGVVYVNDDAQNTIETMNPEDSVSVQQFDVDFPEMDNHVPVNHLPIPEGTDYVDVATLNWTELPSRYIGLISQVDDTTASNAVVLVAESESSRYALRAYSPQRRSYLNWQDGIDDENDTISGAGCIGEGMTTLRLHSNGFPEEDFDLRVICSGFGTRPKFTFITEDDDIPFLRYRHVTSTDVYLDSIELNPLTKRLSIIATLAPATDLYPNAECIVTISSLNGLEMFIIDGEIKQHNGFPGAECGAHINYSVLDMIFSDEIVVDLQARLGDEYLS